MLVEYGEKNGAKFNQAEFEKSKAWIESIIKALIGERLFTKSTYYRIMNNSDSPMGKEFKAALKTFENLSSFSMVILLIKYFGSLPERVKSLLDMV